MMTPTRMVPLFKRGRLISAPKGDGRVRQDVAIANPKPDSPQRQLGVRSRSLRLGRRSGAALGSGCTAQVVEVAGIDLRDRLIPQKYPQLSIEVRSHESGTMDSSRSVLYGTPVAPRSDVGGCARGKRRCGSTENSGRSKPG